MLGAIIGDIVGSIYEFHNIKTKDFPLMTDKCNFTDDTVMTIAVAQAIMDGGTHYDFVTEMRKFGEMFPNAGYGGRFEWWLMSKDPKPYNSFGNGSAMRVSPCGWLGKCVELKDEVFIPAEVGEMAEKSAEITHNHPEGIKGAKATADAIYLCRCLFNQNAENMSESEIRKSKDLIKNHIAEEYSYDLSQTLDEIRPTYSFNETCQDTVPQAIVAFLESTSFEDAIRNAISLGGDSDTLAAITGSIAEAAYGIPKQIEEKALSYLDERLLDVFERWSVYLNSQN